MVVLYYRIVQKFWEAIISRFSWFWKIHSHEETWKPRPSRKAIVPIDSELGSSTWLLWPTCFALVLMVLLLMSSTKLTFKRFMPTLYPLKGQHVRLEYSLPAPKMNHCFYTSCVSQEWQGSLYWMSVVMQGHTIHEIISTTISFQRFTKLLLFKILHYMVYFDAICKLYYSV